MDSPSSSIDLVTKIGVASMPIGAGLGRQLDGDPVAWRW